MNIFSRIFGHSAKQKTVTRLEVTGRPSTFTAFIGDPYTNDIYRSGVDAIARIAAKFQLQPTITFSDGTHANADDRLARILQVEPNPHMSAYDLLYMMHTHLYTRNNAYAYLQRDHGRIVAVWPLHVNSCEFATGRGGQTLCAMTFANGKTTILPYRDIVHLRRHFNSGDVLGDTNDAISAGVQLAEAQNQGITNSIKTSGQIRGIVKYTSALGPSKLKAYKDEFERTQLDPNNAGVILTDSAVEFIPVNETHATINTDDVEQVKRKIYSYLGISERIVDSSFDDDTFGAFDESVIEALALQASLEWTRKVYPHARNRRIECLTSRIRYIGAKNRTELIKNATPMGVLSINETRDLMGLAPIDDGDRFIQSLNYVDAAIAAKYQLFNSSHGGVRVMNLSNDDEEVDGIE